MESMGQSRTSEVQRDARIGEAECNRHANILILILYKVLEGKIVNKIG